MVCSILRSEDIAKAEDDYSFPEVTLCYTSKSQLAITGQVAHPEAGLRSKVRTRPHNWATAQQIAPASSQRRIAAATHPYLRTVPSCDSPCLRNLRNPILKMQRALSIRALSFWLRQGSAQAARPRSLIARSAAPRPGTPGALPTIRSPAAGC